MNTLGYGNPSRNYLPVLLESNYLDSLLPEMQSYPYIDVNTQEAVDEINQLVISTNNIASNEEIQKRYLFYDESFKDYIIDVLSSKNIPKEDVVKIINDLDADIAPLLIKLKYFYQRVRPMQLAYFYEMKLYPFSSKTVDSPSYPSGHALQARIFCEVLGNKYPIYYTQLLQLAEDISNSRIMLGVHYPSDCDFSKYIASVIMQHPEFRKKYKL